LGVLTLLAGSSKGACSQTAQKINTAESAIMQIISV
jgi:hypothetical protein